MFISAPDEIGCVNTFTHPVVACGMMEVLLVVQGTVFVISHHVQVNDQSTHSKWCAEQLPSLVKHIAQVLKDPIKRLVIAASPGCQHFAAAVAVAHAVHNEGLTPYAALVQLQHAHHMLKVSYIPYPTHVAPFCAECMWCCTAAFMLLETCLSRDVIWIAVETPFQCCDTVACYANIVCECHVQAGDVCKQPMHWLEGLA